MMKFMIVLLTLVVIASSSLVDVIPHYSYKGYGQGVSTRYFRKAQGLGYGGYGQGYGGYGQGYDGYGPRFGGYVQGYGGYGLGDGLGYGGYGAGNIGQGYGGNFY